MTTGAPKKKNEALGKPLLALRNQFSVSPAESDSEHSFFFLFSFGSLCRTSFATCSAPDILEVSGLVAVYI